MSVLTAVVALVLSGITPGAAPSTTSGVAAMGAAAPGVLVVEVRFEADVPAHGALRLRHVACPVSDPDGLWPVIADLVIGVGADAGRAPVSRGRLERRLADAGLPAGSVRCLGPSLVELPNRGKP